MKKKNRYILIIIIIAVALIIIGFLSFGHAKKASDKSITVGIMAGTKDDDKFWNLVKKNAQKKYGVTVTYKKFTDYNTPNRALQSGDLDTNAFQNIAFLNAWNKAHNTNVVSVGKTMIAPMQIYSTQLSNIKQLKTGVTIGIPNDTANEARSLLILEAAGLISFKQGSNQATLTPNDISKNPKNIQFKELSAEQIPHSLSSIDAGIINTNYAKAAGLNSSQSIYTEPINKNTEKYASVVATTKKNSNNQAITDYVKSYQSNNVKAEMAKIYGDTKIPAWDLNFNKK